MIDVSVIVVNYKTADLVVKCLQSICQFTHGLVYEIILIDNASKDGSVQTIRKSFANVLIIENSTNVGFGAANNLGIKKAKGEFVFLLNPDAYLLNNNALHTFCEFMRKPANSSVAICGGHLETSTGRPTSSFGNFPTLFELFCRTGIYFFFKQHFLRYISSGVINYNHFVKRVDYITGADMFIRKSALDVVGNFDEDFFMYFEETELSFRMKKNGYLSYILPQICIIHDDGGSFLSAIGFNYKKYELFMRSRILFFRKCYGNYTVFLVKILCSIRETLLWLVKKESGNVLRKLRIIFSS